MPLAENTIENEEFMGFKEIFNASVNSEDGGEDDKTQLAAEDDSKVMLLAENPTERKKFVSCEETTAAKSIHKDGREHLDITELHTCSTGHNSEPDLLYADLLFNKNASGSIDAVGCGDLNVDEAANDSEGLASSSHSIHVTPETADDENDSNGNEPHDEDFCPKDLHRFALQIARGMVNNVLLYLFNVTLTPVNNNLQTF